MRAKFRDRFILRPLISLLIVARFYISVMYISNLFEIQKEDEEKGSDTKG